METETQKPAWSILLGDVDEQGRVMHAIEVKFQFIWSHLGVKGQDFVDSIYAQNSNSIV